MLLSLITHGAIVKMESRPLELIITGFIVVCISTHSIAGESINQQQPIKEQSAEKLINSLKESTTLERQVAYELAPVKSKADLDFISAKPSALDLLSSDAKQRFIESIKFGDKGLAGFYYADLENELSFTQIYEILSLFGATHLISKFSNAHIETSADTLLKAKSINEKKSPGLLGPTDHGGYRCESRATCVRSSLHICTSNC